MSSKGLAFLNKKSWHTGTKAVQERVWKAEEKAKEEAKRITQLQKERAQERAIEELRAAQAKAGLVTSGSVDRLEWMYAGQNKSEKAKLEEALLGQVTAEQLQKEQSANNDRERDNTAIRMEEKRHKSAVNLSLGGRSERDLTTKQLEALLREDPLYLMQQQEQEASSHSVLIKSEQHHPRIKEEQPSCVRIKTETFARAILPSPHSHFYAAAAPLPLPLSTNAAVASPLSRDGYKRKQPDESSCLFSAPQVLPIKRSRWDVQVVEQR